VSAASEGLGKGVSAASEGLGKGVSAASAGLGKGLSSTGEGWGKGLGATGNMVGALSYGIGEGGKGALSSTLSETGDLAGIVIKTTGQAVTSLVKRANRTGKYFDKSVAEYQERRKRAEVTKENGRQITGIIQGDASLRFARNELITSLNVQKQRVMDTINGYITGMYDLKCKPKTISNGWKTDTNCNQEPEIRDIVLRLNVLKTRCNLFYRTLTTRALSANTQELLVKINLENISRSTMMLESAKRLFDAFQTTIGISPEEENQGGTQSRDSGRFRSAAAAGGTRKRRRKKMKKTLRKTLRKKVSRPRTRRR